MGEARLPSKMDTEAKRHASVDIQNTATVPSSTALATTPKTSMFAKKIGFVIPKNKLSGSLVPLSRGTKKADADVAKEEATNQVQRKTKWGPDPAADNTVRKGRALAYQTRINQISQQLTLGALELEDNEDSLSTSEFQYEKASDHQLSKEESELLELERREIIGEILKLNPTYKAPADYKPILKEAKVPIPIKEYPGYNFIGLVFGSASDTHKRLEKETGAKIQVYGTKADTGVKVQVTPTDGKEIDDAYEDLYIHVSADTFEKIDAAVSLIELLVTPVSVNPVSSSTTSNAVSDDKVNAQSSQSQPTSIVGPTPINQGSTQPYPGSLPPPQGQFPQYPQPWFSAGPAHTPTYPQSRLVSPTNSSAPLLNNTVQVPSSPFNPTNMPSLFGPQPVLPPSFSPVPQNPSNFLARPQLPSYLQQAPPHNIRPIISPSPQSAPLTTSFSDRPMNPQNVPSHGHHAMHPQNMSVSGASQPSNPSNMNFSPSQQFRPLPNPFSGNGRNFDPVKPLSSDFTFQPQRQPPNAAPQFWQNSQPPHHHNVRPIQTGPQSPFLRPMVPLNSPPVGPAFQRPQMSHQPMPTNFAGSPTGPQMPPRHAMLPHMQQPRNFIPMNSNNSGPFPPRPGNHHLGAMHPQRHHPMPPHQQFGNHNGRPFSSSSGVQQTYDPFSPTSTTFSNNPQMGSNNAARVHGETDPEYDDLMASVGVK
ncbi:hypothetical protein ACP275_04G231500 [Erythranthe tilingii]